MAVTLFKVGRTPQQPQFGLDQFTEHYKCNDAADVVLTDAGVPQKGDAHPDYQFMFLTDRYCMETGQSASALDLVYIGVFGRQSSSGTLSVGTKYVILSYESGDDFTNVGGANVTGSMFFATDTTPADWSNGSVLLGAILPPRKPTSGGQVASATTNTSAAIFPSVATNPATVQFYAITNTLDFFTNNPGDEDVQPDDPPTIDSLITWDLGFGVQPGLSMPDLVAFLLTEAFIQGIIEPQPEIEPIVSGQYYHVIKRKTRTLFPYAPPS